MSIRQLTGPHPWTIFSTSHAQHNSPVWGAGNPNCCSSSPSSSRRRASVDRRDWLREFERPAAAGWSWVSGGPDCTLPCVWSSWVLPAAPSALPCVHPP